MGVASGAGSEAGSEAGAACTGERMAAGSVVTSCPSGVKENASETGIGSSSIPSTVVGF